MKNLKMKKQNSKKAFSLIELIFIIAVLGIIAAVAVPKLLDSRSNAVVTTLKQDILTITTAIQSHYMLNNSIEKITDTVNINEGTWIITDKKLEHKVEKATCITIEILDNKLLVDIDETTSDACKKIADLGIKDESYELF